MPRLKLPLLSRALVLVCLITACGRDQVVAPAELVRLSDSESPENAAVQQEIEGLTAFVSKNGGLDQSLAQGADPELISLRRQRMKARLRELEGRRLELSSRPIGGRQAAIYEEVPPEILPGCVSLATLSANNCFLDQTTAINYGGTGSVYQIAQFLWNHSTTTTVDDNGTLIATRNTASFGMQASWAAAFTFVPLDPNCFNADHTITGATTHKIRLGVSGYGFVLGEESSINQSFCQRKYLTVSVSPSEISVGETASITVGHLPAGCNYGVTSSNEEVASIQNPGQDIWAAMGLSGGAVTIAARCSDGTSGSASLSVTQPDTNPTPPPPSGGGPIYRNDYEPGDGFSDPTGQWVCMLYWHAWSSYDGGQTWQDDGRECINWSWQEDATSRVPDPSVSAKPMRPHLLTRPGLRHVAGDAGSGPLASATSAASQSPSVTVVITPNAPRVGLAALTRRVAGHGSPIVVRLRESELTPELLGAAFSAVPSLLAREARQPVKDSEYRVGENVELAPLPAAYREWLREIIARLVAGDQRLGSEFDGSRAITLKLNRSP